MLRVKSPKAASAQDCHRLEQLPNIGPAMAADLRALGIAHPHDLASRDAFVLYQALCAPDFMRGAAPAPWWAYTAQRKRVYGSL